MYTLFNYISFLLTKKMSYIHTDVFTHICTSTTCTHICSYPNIFLLIHLSCRKGTKHALIRLELEFGYLRARTRKHIFLSVISLTKLQECKTEYFTLSGSACYFFFRQEKCINISGLERMMIVIKHQMY